MEAADCSASFRELDAGLLEDWMKGLPVRAVTENMMRWQRYYSKPCGASCCFSPDCACIRCSSCARSMTSLPPKRRFQCMLCELLPPESAFDGRPEYCSECFARPDVLHWHDVFLLVDETGKHLAVRRMQGLAEQATLVRQTFRSLELCPATLFVGSAAVNSLGTTQQPAPLAACQVMGMVLSTLGWGWWIQETFTMRTVA